VARHERRVALELSVSDATLYLTLGGEVLSGVLLSHRLA
jgi:hypothetical protein